MEEYALMMIKCITSLLVTLEALESLDNGKTPIHQAVMLCTTTLNLDEITSIHVYVQLVSAYAQFITDGSDDHVSEVYRLVEDVFARALEHNPNKLATICAYAEFLTDVRNDHVKAGEFYNQAHEVSRAWGDEVPVGDFCKYVELLVHKLNDIGYAFVLIKERVECGQLDSVRLAMFASLLAEHRSTYTHVDDDMDESNIIQEARGWFNMARQDTTNLDEINQYCKISIKVCSMDGKTNTLPIPWAWITVLELKTVLADTYDISTQLIELFVGGVEDPLTDDMILDRAGIQDGSVLFMLVAI